MMTVRDGLDDCYFTWIDVKYALPATDDNMIVTVKEADGSSEVEMGFYDGTGWHDFNGKDLDTEGRSVIAWLAVMPHKRRSELMQEEKRGCENE